MGLSVWSEVRFEAGFTRGEVVTVRPLRIANYRRKSGRRDEEMISSGADAFSSTL